METFITVLQILSCVIIVAAVLLQPAKGGGSFISGGGNSSVLGASGGTTFLFRVTMWTAAFIMASCLFLSSIKIRSTGKSVTDDLAGSVPVPTSANSAPANPGTGGGAANTAETPTSGGAESKTETAPESEAK